MRKIQKSNLHEIVVEEIKAYIKEHQLREGDKLPSAAFFSESLGVGRSSVREGLRHLEATGYITVRNGKGIFVKDPDSVRIEARVKVNDEKVMMLQLCEVRRAVEGQAVMLAAKRATDEELDQMTFYLDEYQRLRDAGLDTSQADLEFHKKIYDAAHNPVLGSVVNSIWDIFNKFWQRPFGIPTIFEDTYPLHRLLLEALKKRDVSAAKAEFDKLMDALEQTIESIAI